MSLGGVCEQIYGNYAKFDKILKTLLGFYGCWLNFCRNQPAFNRNFAKPDENKSEFNKIFNKMQANSHKFQAISVNPQGNQKK
jgi:hypothetical protein